MGAKLALVGDLQFDEKVLAAVAGAWEDTLERCQKEKTVGMLQAGDVFERFNVAGRAASFGTVFAAFSEPLRRNLPGETIIIPGNHDKAGPGQKDALVPMDGVKGIRVAHSPQVIQGPRYAVACLPWLTKANLIAKEEFRNLAPSALDEVYQRKLADIIYLLKDELGKAHGYKILLGHCEIPGVKMSNEAFLMGGNFCLDKNLLEQVGADRIVLGHIHKRQGYYLGSLTQLTFGDEGNPAGFELLDLETGDSEFIGIDSPRYWTFTTQEWTGTDAPKSLPATDHIKIRGTEMPSAGGLFPELPPGVIFEKIVESTVMTRRLSENLDPTAGPLELLKVWARETACPIPPEALVAGLEPLLAGEQAQPAAIGSLKRITRLVLKNVASHQDTDIRLQDGVTAITGHNGAGKTFLLEAPMAVLYGSFPSRPGPLFGYVPRIGTASLEMEFESDGRDYRARREIKLTEKTQGQVGYLVLDEKTIAGGPAKLEDFERTCQEVIGDPNLVKASVFASQNQAGDLVDAKPTERKELVHKLLGLEWLALISRAAKDRSLADSGRIQEIETALRDGRNELGLLEGPEGLLVQLSDILSRLGKKQAERLNLEQARDKVLAEKVKAQQIEKERAALADKKATLLRDLGEVKTEIANLQKEKDTIADLLAKEPEIKKNLLELKDLREKSEKARVRELARTRRLSRITELEQAITFAERALTAERKTLQEKLAAAEKQTAILAAGDFTAEACQTCRFLSGAREGAKTAAKIQDQLDEIEITILDKKFAEEEQKELKTLQPVSDEADPQEYKHITDRILELQSSERLSGQIEQVKKQAITLQSTSARLRKKANEIADRWGAIKDQEIPVSNLSTVDAEEARLANVMAELNNNISGLNIDQGKIKKDIERLEKLAKELTAKEAEVESTRGIIAVNEALARAFGKDGIPQLLIDSAIPQIQDILNDLLSGLDNAFAISISTQRVSKADRVGETLDIIVSDAAGSRDIASFSGGEQKMLRTVLRIALAIFQSQRAGKRLEVFFADEVFDSLDRDNAIRMLGILARLGERFTQVFLVSHTDDLIADLPNVIRLERKNGKTEVVCGL